MNTPKKLEVAKRDIRLSGVLVEVDEETGKARRVSRIHEYLGE
jgi:calcineurin-like phosphoesterase